LRRKLTIKQIKNKVKEITNSRYKCISEYYINSKSKLKFICDRNHTFLMAWNCIQQGQRCPICKTYTIDEIKNITKNKVDGYVCISDSYVNNYSKLEFKCDNGHTFNSTWVRFNIQNYRCPICYALSRYGSTNPNWKGGVTKLNMPLYDTYAHQIDFCEEVRRDPENNDYLQVRCTESSCREWFRSSTKAIHNRLKTINGKMGGESRFYCSEECKQKCSLYNQVKHPKGFININNIRYNQPEWAQMVKEKDEYKCVKCNSTEKLVAHHIEGLNENPIESADIDLGVTLCKKCHKEVHEEIGCRFVDMRKVNFCPNQYL